MNDMVRGEKGKQDDAICEQLLRFWFVQFLGVTKNELVQIRKCACL